MKRWMLCLLGLIAVQAQAADKPEVLPLPKTNEVVLSSPSVSDTIVTGEYEQSSCGVRGCMGRLWSWLKYRPIQGAAASCGCKQYTPCCRPELHAFFLHRCRACVEDNREGIPITASYTDLLRQSGPCLSHYGCGCR